MEGIIYINGIIGENYTIQNALLDIKRTQLNETIALGIGSDGGFVDVADEIADLFIKTGKVVRSFNTGNVASAAVKLFLIPPMQNRKFDTSKGQFLIHNPYGTIEGDSKTLEMAAAELNKIEKSLADFYSKQTGTAKEIILGFMNINEPLTNEQITELGFANLYTQELKAVAKLNINQINNNKMDEEKTNKFLEKFENLFNKVAQKLGFKNLLVADGEGKNLDFGDQIETIDQIAVGMTAKYEDGTIPTGEVAMPDGSVYVFDEAGTITEIKPVEQTPDENADMEALKAENETLKAEIETMKAATAKAETEFQAKLKDFKAEIKSEFVNLLEENPDKKENDKPVNRFAKKDK